MHSIHEVRSFWDNNPLFSGEIEFDIGTKEWFDAFDGIKKFIMRPEKMHLWIGNDLVENKIMLDVGCGPGFWCRAVSVMPNVSYYGIDISPKTVELAKQSAIIFDTSCNINVGNAESIYFPDNTFDHVISEGVIHHTMNTELAAKEIVRVLKVGGTATFSVYYKNIVLRNSILFGLSKFFMRFFSLSIQGRARGNMSLSSNVDDFIRQYDGAGNPIGKGYDYDQAINLVPKNCKILNSYLYYSPFRAFYRNRFHIINNILDGYFGLMISMHIKKYSL